MNKLERKIPNHHRLMISIVVAAVSVLVASISYAAGTTFELENKASANIKYNATAGADWASLFDVPGPELASPPGGTDGITPTPKASLPAGIFKAEFFRDFLIGQSSDSTTFTTGTKDIQNISGGGMISGEWQCKKSNNISSKGNALNAYAMIYEHETTGDIILGMGIERASSDGTSKVGFWFLGDESVDCESTGKAQTFTGNHVDGDILAVIDFEQGGNNPTAKVFQWQGDAATGALVLVATGSECTAGTSNTCATTNQAQTLLHSAGDPPWLTQTKTNGPNFSPDLKPLMFFEAQVNLTQEELQACFTKFVPNTRQSASVNATVFDYMIGDFNVCGFSAGKTCTNAAVSTGGTQVDYTFNVKATNTGIVPLNVSVTEQTSGCSVTSANPVNNLAAGADADFTVSCPNQGLGVTNTAQVSATTASADATPVLPSKTVSALSTEFPACSPNPTSDITLTSECDKVILEVAGSRLGLDATIGGLVKAPTAGSEVEALNNVKLKVYDKTCTGDVSLCTLVESIDIDSQLIPGEADKSWSHNYDVGIGDNTSTSQCAANAIFQRRVIASGTGAISGDTYYSTLVEGVPMAVPVDCNPCIDCTDPAVPPE